MVFYIVYVFYSRTCQKAIDHQCESQMIRIENLNIELKQRHEEDVRIHLYLNSISWYNSIFT
jgi:hypothetical protein